jgi:long-chain acyl-CoA synthetase
MSQTKICLCSACTAGRPSAQTIFLTQPLAGTVRDWTWAQAMDEVCRIAAHLKSFAWEPGCRVALYSKNCAWRLLENYAI